MLGLHAHDARNQRVARVRATRRVDGGILVRMLIPIHDGGASGAAINQDGDVVEAEAFIEGGSLMRRVEYGPIKLMNGKIEIDEKSTT